MFLPIGDINPRRIRPRVTVAIILANAAVFVLQAAMLGTRAQQGLAYAAGAIPIEIVNRVDVGPVAALVPPPFTIMTAMFLHGGFMHLVGNMWFLWLFGDNIEDRLGHGRYALFYAACGIVAALAQCYLMPTSRIPMIGASGAVAGVLGAYLILFPHARVRTLVLIPLLWPVFEIPAFIFLGLWFLGQFFIGSDSGIAWMAHVGGFLAGLGMVRLLLPSRPPREVLEAEYIPPRRF